MLTEQPVLPVPWPSVAHSFHGKGAHQAESLLRFNPLFSFECFDATSHFEAPNTILSRDTGVLNRYASFSCYVFGSPLPLGLTNCDELWRFRVLLRETRRQFFFPSCALVGSSRRPPRTDLYYSSRIFRFRTYFISRSEQLSLSTASGQRLCINRSSTF